MPNVGQYSHTLKQEREPNMRTRFQSFVENKETASKRYYSGCDVEIYFGDKFIDEAVYGEFTLNESTMLLYGYNSYVYDQVAKGTRMVQGALVVNFTKSNYLFDVFSTLSQLKGYGIINPSRFHPVWPLGFDLYFSYGGTKEISKNTQLIRLQDVQLTSVSMQHDSRTGQPITETYSFIGRDVVFDTTSPTLSLEETETPTENITQATKRAELIKGNYDKSKHKIDIYFDQTVQFTKVQYSFNKSNTYRSLSATIPTDYLVILLSEDLYDTYPNTGYVMLYLDTEYTLYEQTFKEKYTLSIKLQGF